MGVLTRRDTDTQGEARVRPEAEIGGMLPPVKKRQEVATTSEARGEARDTCPQEPSEGERPRPHLGFGLLVSRPVDNKCLYSKPPGL